MELLSNKSDVGRFLASKRTFRRWTQVQLAEKANLSPSTIVGIEGGNGTEDSTMKAARALGFDRMTLGHLAEVLWPMGAE